MICSPSCFCRSFVHLDVFLLCGDTHVWVFLFRSRRSWSTFVRQYTCIGHFPLFNTCCRWIFRTIFLRFEDTYRFFCVFNTSDTCIVFLRFQYMCSGWCIDIASRQYTCFGVVVECQQGHSRSFYVGTMDDWVKYLFSDAGAGRVA